MFNPARRDKWVFGDRDSGAYLLKFAWTKIIRHQMVKDVSSPDDPTLDRYWATRRRRGPPAPLNTVDLRLLKAQAGRCPLCTDLLLSADSAPQSPHEWELWQRAIRRAITKQNLLAQPDAGTPDETKLRLVHAFCQRRYPTGTGSSPATLLNRTPPGLA